MKRPRLCCQVPTKRASEVSLLTDSLQFANSIARSLVAMHCIPALLLLVTLAQASPLSKEASLPTAVTEMAAVGEGLLPRPIRQGVLGHTSRGQTYRRTDGDAEGRPRASPLGRAGPQKDKDFEEMKTLTRGQECQDCETMTSEKQAKVSERFDEGGGEDEGRVKAEDRPESAAALGPAESARDPFRLDFIPEENLHHTRDESAIIVQKPHEPDTYRRKSEYGMKTIYSDDSSTAPVERPYPAGLTSPPVAKEEKLSEQTESPGSADTKTEVLSVPESDDESEKGKYNIRYSVSFSEGIKVKYDGGSEFTQTPEKTTQQKTYVGPEYEEKIEPSKVTEYKASPTELGPEHDTDIFSGFKLLPTETTITKSDLRLEEGVHAKPTPPGELVHPEQVTQPDPHSQMLQPDTNTEYSVYNEQHHQNSKYETVSELYRQNLGHTLSRQNLEFKIYPEQVKSAEPISHRQRGGETYGPSDNFTNHKDSDPTYTDTGQDMTSEHETRPNTKQEHHRQGQHGHQERKTSIQGTTLTYKKGKQHNNTVLGDALDQPSEIQNLEVSPISPSPPTRGASVNLRYHGTFLNGTYNQEHSLHIISEETEQAEIDSIQTTTEDSKTPSRQQPDGVSGGVAEDGEGGDGGLQGSEATTAPEDKALFIVYADTIEDKKSPEEEPTVEYVYGEEYLYYYDIGDDGEVEYPEPVDYSQPGAKTRPLSRESKLLYFDTVVGSVLQLAPRGSQLIGARGDQLPPLVNRLVENATLIRPNLNDSFSCEERVYGYYADQYNDCQVFHVCVPLHQLFPGAFTTRDLYHFSFICPEHTIFTQDAMVCSWRDSALPCSEAHHLYDLNNLFFVVAEEFEKETTTPSSVTASTSRRPSSSPGATASAG